MNGIVYTTNKENDNKYFLSFNNKITKTKDKNNIGAKKINPNSWLKRIILIPSNRKIIFSTNMLMSKNLE